MSRFRDWPPRRIGLMWLIGAVLQGLALFAVPPLLGWEMGPPADAPEPGWLDSMKAVPDNAPDSARVPRVTVTRTEVAPGDTLVRVERDTSWLQFRTNGGDVEMSPDVEQAAERIGGMMTSMIVAMGVAVLQLLLLIFTIPAVLVAVTLAWLAVRRAPSRG